MTRSFTSILFALGLSAHAAEVRLYSERHYDADKKVFAAFTEKTGIDVKVVKAGANELIARLKSEVNAPQADLYITTDAASLTKATKAGLLTPLKSEIINKQVPASLRGKDDTWAAFTMRGRVIVYAKDRVKGNLPKSYQDLASPAYKGNILIRSSSNKYNRSLLASLIAIDGKAKATKWATGVKKNLARPPQGSDRDQVRALAKGLGDFAVVNTYYLGLLEQSSNEEDQKARAAVKVIFPTSGDQGTHVNVSGGGIIKGAANQENARKFLEFLVSEEVQKLYQKLTSEYAVVPGIELEPLQKSWGKISPDRDTIHVMGEHDQEAVKIFNFVGWK
jgi:iron(III) transport system substrate-binding protein